VIRRGWRRKVLLWCYRYGKEACTVRGLDRQRQAISPGHCSRAVIGVVGTALEHSGRECPIGDNQGKKEGEQVHNGTFENRWKSSDDLW
jgi:hypothetical protein